MAVALRHTAVEGSRRPEYIIGRGRLPTAGSQHAANVAPYSDDPAHPDYRDFSLYKQGQIDLCGGWAEIELVGEAHAIPVANGSQDFVLASHVAEHLPDLYSAFREWNRVLKPGGIVFLILPHRDALPSDQDRPLTSVEHLRADYKTKATPETHVSEDGQDTPPRGHYHVFTLDTFKEAVERAPVKLKWELMAEEAVDSKVGNGFTVVYRKPALKVG